MADPEDPSPPEAPIAEEEPVRHWEMTRRGLASDMDDFDAAFETRSGALGERLWPTISYLLMILAPLTLGLCSIPALFIAFSGDKTAPGWLRTHYMFQMRTFWIGALLLVMALLVSQLEDRIGVMGLLAGVLMWAILLMGLAWFVVRMAIGLGRLRRGEPFRNYRTLMV